MFATVECLCELTGLPISLMQEGLVIPVVQDILHQKTDHSMGSRAGVERPVSSPELSDTLLLENLDRAVHQILVGELACNGINTHVHQTAFNKIEGKSSEGTDKSGNGGREKARRVTSSGVGDEQLLALIVGSEHTHVHGNSTEHHGDRASPESEQALLLGNTADSGEHVGVATALLHGSLAISLHAHHGNVERVSSETTNSSRDHGGGDLLVEGDGVTSIALLQDFGDLVVQSQTGSSIHSLTHDGGGQTSVELGDAAFAHNLASHAEGAHTSTVGRNDLHLHAGLQKVHGVHTHRSSNSSTSTSKVGLQGFSNSVVRTHYSIEGKRDSIKKKNGLTLTTR